MITSEVVEHASVVHDHGGRDAEIRARARHAPAWIKRRIDADRQRRGMRPLWAVNDDARRRAAGKIQSLRAFLVAARLQAGISGS